MSKKPERPALRCPKYGWMKAPDGFREPFLYPRPLAAVSCVATPDPPTAVEFPIEVCEFVMSNYAANIAVCRTHKVTQDGPPQIFAGKDLNPAPGSLS